MSEQKGPVVHELTDVKFIFLLLGSFVFIVAGGAYLLFFSPSMANMTYLPALRIAFPICIVMQLAAILRLLCCRVHIDETGVTADRLPFGQNSLRWEEIATAAIVHLRIGRSNEPIIVLATLPPEQVLTRKALLGYPGLPPHEHIRLTRSKTRVAAIEHYLHMRLPEYHL